MMRFLVLPAVVLGTLTGAVRPADAPKLALKHARADPPADLAEAVRKLLPGECEQVADAGGSLVAEVWFRDDIPTLATEEQAKNGLTYRELPPGVLLGAVRFPAPFVDYRKQTIPAGAYTLRFAVQPDIGDHTGTAPHPEFCLMSPAGKDKSAEPLAVKSLIERSSEVNEGKHPVVLLLFPNYAKDDGPKVVGKGDGVWVVNVRRPVAAGETKTTLGFGITVAGMWKQ